MISKLSVKKIQKFIRAHTIVIFILLLLIGSFLLYRKLQMESRPFSQRTSSCLLPEHYRRPMQSPGFTESDCSFSGGGRNVLIKELDRESCKKISLHVVVDKYRVYKQLFDPGSSDIAGYITIQGADSNTFKDLDYGFYADSKHVYYDTGDSYRILRSLDRKSTQLLAPYYFKDKNNIYFAPVHKSDALQPLTGFDQETFEAIENEENHGEYFKDKNGVYFIGDKRVEPIAVTDVILGADIETFMVLPYFRFAIDKNFVYHNGVKIEGADPETFRVLGAGYFKDNSRVYTIIGGLRVLPGIDGCTYENIGFLDETRWRGYSKDRERIYFRGAVVTGADRASFKVDGERAYDKNFEYQGIFRKK